MQKYTNILSYFNFFILYNNFINYKNYFPLIFGFAFKYFLFIKFEFLLTFIGLIPLILPVLFGLEHK